MILGAYTVTIRIPPGMSPEQAGRELRSCITFGQPEVELMAATEVSDGDPES